jgi:capsular exopolysaccharide synthesis family protein
MATMNTRIISPPSGDLEHVRPKEKLIFMIALFFGICIPGGIIWGKEILNDTIRDKNELDGLSVPLLGVIPEAKSTEMKKFLLVQKYGAGPINESFRFLRTRIGRICTNDTKVIQITSMEPGSGKTFIAVNLAMCFALAGKKVALLDLDFRKATLSRLINSPEFGMYHLLSGLVLHERYFIEKNYFYNGFDILPTGPLPVDPSELLLSDNLEKLIKRFKTTYDYIFVDCPPVNLVTDAEIFAALADFSIFVIRENHTKKGKLDEIKKIKQEEQFKNMHIVLNGSVADIQPDIYYDLYNKSIHALPKATEVWKSSGYLTEGTNR